MKRILSLIVVLHVIGLYHVSAQCSTPTNRFALQLVHKTQGELSVQFAYQAMANEELPSLADYQLAGLVFAVSWPSTSAISIADCQTKLTPFALQIDKSAQHTEARTAAPLDQFATFYHANDMPVAFGKDWQPNQWYEIAIVRYNGTLSAGDAFSLLNCDYGLANPNSYSGNSSTDPWFALMSPDNSLEQYSPKMITEVSGAASQNQFMLYPNPAKEELQVRINAMHQTQVIISVLDMQGRVIRTTLCRIEKGNNQTQIQMGGLVPGNYLIKMTDGKTMFHQQQITKI